MGTQGQDGGIDRDLEIDAITNSLTQRAVETGNNKDIGVNSAPQNNPLNPPLGQGTGGLGTGGQGAALGAKNSSHWSMGDLLARASESDPLGSTNSEDAPQPLSFTSGDQGALGQSTTPPININAIAQLVDQAAAVELWRTYRSGLKTKVSEAVYNDNGEAFRQISGLYSTDLSFKANVDRYITDFDRLLNDAEAKDPAGNLSTKHLTSEGGRVYLLLMHASGRIGG